MFRCMKRTKKFIGIFQTRPDNERKSYEFKNVKEWLNKRVQILLEKWTSTVCKKCRAVNFRESEREGDEEREVGESCWERERIPYTDHIEGENICIRLNEWVEERIRNSRLLVLILRWPIRSNRLNKFREIIMHVNFFFKYIPNFERLLNSTSQI